ncbi:hypothetical protein [uncultured Sphingorhabdus sp.]|uniref:hypothetical protein n=1 Tax=uncultured Sphingorhabdus sp. TaxID=1686106 RepID=UPI00260FD17F|nr:hypothetical protein [uncultured Sphingorhabdus sp.]HMS22036.1 hypothetical protein [Sphingorhabdus sp.]
MKSEITGSAAFAALVLLASPLAAQTAEAPAEAAPAPAEPVPAAAPAPTEPVPAAAPAPAAPVSECELRVWPTENYLGVNMGLLSGFGIVGALADQEVHKGKVQTVKDLMREYLGPEVQLEELNRMGILKTLKLPENYRIVIEPPTPFNEDLKDNPELKAKVKAMNATIKAKKRLTDSQSKCYAELITTHIFYHKAMMYGSNLFTGWIYRDFKDKAVAPVNFTGQVKNPLEYFPPKTTEDVEKAKVELRDAYSKDFVEYTEKKVHGAAKK